MAYATKSFFSTQDLEEFLNGDAQPDLVTVVPHGMTLIAVYKTAADAPAKASFTAAPEPAAAPAKAEIREVPPYHQPTRKNDDDDESAIRSVPRRK